MKLIAVYTPSHKVLLDDWFLPGLQDDFDVILHKSEIIGSGAYMQKDWSDAVLFKCDAIIDAITKNWGEVFVYSDVDIEFFASMKNIILNAMQDKDIVCQLDSPNGVLCTGFFAAKANEQTLALWQDVRKAILIEHRDQKAFNRLIRAQRDIRFGYLPLGFFGAGTFNDRQWHKGQPFYIPTSPVMFHANFTIGLDNKVAALKQAKKIISEGGSSIFVNNCMAICRYGPQKLFRAKNKVN